MSSVFPIHLKDRLISLGVDYNIVPMYATAPLNREQRKCYIFHEFRSKTQLNLTDAMSYIGFRYHCALWFIGMHLRLTGSDPMISHPREIIVPSNSLYEICNVAWYRLHSPVKATCRWYPDNPNQSKMILVIIDASLKYAPKSDFFLV